MQKENKMGIMPIPKLLLNMSLPIMISMLVQSMYNIVDGIFVSKISQDALTATSIAYSAQMLQIAVAVGTGVGVNAVISRYLGAKQIDKVKRTATTGLVLTVLSSCIFMLWGIFGTKAFITQFTHNTEIIHLGTSYLRICQLYCMGIFLGTFFQRLLQSTGKTFLSMLAQLFGAVVNIVLDPVLIFGLLNFPKMGITGAAIATVIGQWSAAVIGLLLHIGLNKEVKFELQGFKIEKEIILSIYKVGAPTIIVQSIGSVMVAMMNMILGSFDELAVTFFGIYFKTQSFLFMPMNGLGQGTLPIVAYNYGAKNKERVKEVSKLSILFACGIGCIGTLIFMLCPSQILNLFSASASLKEIGIPALRIICIVFPLSSITMVIGYIISGLGNGMVNMSATAIRQIIVFLPAAYILGHLFGVNSIWFCFWISEALAFIYAVYQFKKYQI